MQKALSLLISALMLLSTTSSFAAPIKTKVNCEREMLCDLTQCPDNAPAGTCKPRRICYVSYICPEPVMPNKEKTIQERICTDVETCKVKKSCPPHTMEGQENACETESMVCTTKTTCSGSK